VREVRLRHDPNEAMGLGAHITVLGPFLPSDLIKAADRQSLRAIFRRTHAFPFTLAEVGWFDHRVLYLAPRPEQPFATLTAAVSARWRLQPYGRPAGAVRPHLTVARAEGITGAQALVPILERGLPVPAVAREVRLYATDEVSWRLLDTLPLG
jgi:2'-5' RNA ligase